jgi:allantoin racemase
MKVLYLNPIATNSFDDMFAEQLCAVKNADTELHIASLPADIGMREIEYSVTEGMIGPYILNAVYHAANQGYDAFIIGCFYDTMLTEAREISGDMMVTGPCESAVMLAPMVSNRFSILLGKEKSRRKVEENLSKYNALNRLCSFEFIDRHVEEFHQDREETIRRLLTVAEMAIGKHAEAIILGCTLETGFLETLQQKLTVPVIDPAIAALKFAEMAAELKLKSKLTKSRLWSCEPPDVVYLDKIMDPDFRFGNVIVVK